MVELHTFETISEATGGTIDRLSVAGGWLYRTRTWDNRSNSFGTSLAYVPDSGATGGGQPAAAAGTCFWYANLLGINLAPDDEPHTLPIGEGYPFGATELISAADGGFSVNQQCVCIIDLWTEFVLGPVTADNVVCISLDKAGTHLPRGAVQLLPGMILQHTGYSGLLQVGEIVRPAAICGSGDALSVAPTSYITAHIVPLVG